MKKYLISDLHLGHKGIERFRKRCRLEDPTSKWTPESIASWDRPKNEFVLMSSEEQHEATFEAIAKLGKRDMLYILGDCVFTEEWLKRLLTIRCRMFLVGGNHDLPLKQIVQSGAFEQVWGLYKHKGAWLSHAPIHPMELWGKVNIHGHCVDTDTEILTRNGWRSWQQIREGDHCYSFNPDKCVLEDDSVKEVIKFMYTGDMYTLNARGLSMRVTGKHRVPFHTAHREYVVETAHKAFQRSTLKIWKAGQYTSNGINLSDDMLRLYIMLAADGNITKYDLARLRIKKQRKINLAKRLLEDMQIPYTENKCARGMTNINFRLPVELKEWKIKGLDLKLTLCNGRQAKIVKEMYSKTDGNRDLIFTSKMEEVDILQHMFVINGYSVKVHERSGHGFSKNVSYQLSVTLGQSQHVTKVKNRVKKEFVENEQVWCIRNNNKNFLARRNGSVFLTGNCHHHLMLDECGKPDPRYKNVCMEYTGWEPQLWDYVMSEEYDRHCHAKWLEYRTDGVINNSLS